MQKIIILITLFTFGCNPSKHIIESRQLLKEYAFCKCIQFASHDSVLFKKDISNGVYREIAYYNFDTYNMIDSFSKITASHILPSIIADHEGKKAVFLDCFIYYKSKVLDLLVKSLDKNIQKGW